MLHFSAFSEFLPYFCQKYYILTCEMLKSPGQSGA
jgi:hypothetical protein